jgi:hypothetical protein
MLAAVHAAPTTPFSPYPIWATTGTIYANAIQIGFAEEDSTDNEGGSSGLSKAAIVAIAVVIPLVVLALLIAAIVWFLHKKKRKARIIHAGDGERDDFPEPIQNLHEFKPIHEADSATVSHTGLLGSALHSRHQTTKPPDGIEVVHELHEGVSRDDPLPAVAAVSHDTHTQDSDGAKEVSRDAEGLIPLGNPDQTRETRSERDAIQQELRRVREERELLYMDQLARRERDLEERLRGL